MINVHACHPLPRLEWIEAALAFNMMLVTEIVSYVGASLIVGIVRCGNCPIMLSIFVGMIIVFIFSLKK